MEQTTIDNIVRWLTLLTMIVALVGTFAIIGTAAIQSLRNRVVRWDMLAYVLVILWSLPYGIRNYGPELADASIDLLFSLAEKRPAMESAIRSFLGDELGGDSGNTAVTVPTAEFTPTPMPTIANQTDFAATATDYFGDFPTALPAMTPTPEYTPTRSLQDFEAQATVNAAGNPTPAPTVFICRTAEDVMAGCQPPTPVPGN
jgi:hypothetical protein